MKCVIPEISYHNRDPVLSVDFQVVSSNVLHFNYYHQQQIDISSEMKTLSAPTAGSADQVSHSRVRHPRRHLGREAGAGGQGGAQLPL